MARRTPISPPKSAALSANEIKAAIQTLKRRLRELEATEINDWNDEIENSLDALQVKVEGTLIDVFGADTLDYKRFEVPQFVNSVRINTNGTRAYEWVEGYRKAIGKAASNVRTAIEVLNEKIEDMGETPGGQALRAYDGLELHPEIDLASGTLYRDGHYANAIEDAVKALTALVRLRSGIDDKDGTTLMEHVFSPKKPVLKFNSLADQSDRDEQKGYMMMFSGAVSGLRNPRAHKFFEDDAERALEFIAFISLLAKLLDGAEKAYPTERCSS